MPNENRQTLLTSATLSTDVKQIKRLLAQNGGPRIRTLRLRDGLLPAAKQLRQYHVRSVRVNTFRFTRIKLEPTQMIE